MKKFNAETIKTSFSDSAIAFDTTFNRELAHDDTAIQDKTQHHLRLANLKSRTKRANKFSALTDKSLKTMYTHCVADDSALVELAIYHQDKIISLVKFINNEAKLNKTLLIAYNQFIAKSKTFTSEQLVATYKAFHYSQDTANSQKTTTIQTFIAFNMIKKVNDKYEINAKSKINALFAKMSKELSECADKYHLKF